jgi:hypothetical protein
MWRPGAWRKLNVVAVLAAAALGLSCNAGLDSGGVTGPTPMSELPGLDEAGTFEASSHATSLVCHKGRDLLVAPSAVAAHLAHGDTEGPCEAACPCYTAEEVAASAAACSDPVTLCIQGNGSYLCEIQCPGESYDYFLAANSCEGQGGSSSIDATQFQACFDILRTECPSFNAL